MAFGRRAHSVPPPPPEHDGGQLTAFGRHRLMVFAPSKGQPQKDAAEAPEVELAREHVYGMEGAKPGSVHLTADGRCVYIAARLGVVEDLLRPSQTYFEGHNAELLCLSYNSQLDLAISGQQEPPGIGSSYACVWCPSHPSRALCELRCFEDRKAAGQLKGPEIPRSRVRTEGKVDYPGWFDPTTMDETQLRGISAVALAAHGRFAVMTAMDDKRSVCLFRLPDAATKPLTTTPQQTYVLRVPTMLVRGSSNICDLALGNPFDPLGRFRFAGLTKTALKLWEYREGAKELVSNAVVFGKAPQQHLSSVAYAWDAGQLLMCGKEGQLYNVQGCHVHQSGRLGPNLGCCAPLAPGGGFDYLAGCADGAFVLGRFEQDPPVKAMKSRPLGIRPQALERFVLEDLPSPLGQEFPRGLRPHWRNLQVNERWQALAASEGHILVFFDLGLAPGSKRRILRVLQVGHKAEAWALAHHPRLASLCASADQRGVVHFWDLEKRQALVQKTYRSDQPVNCLEFNPEGDLLALGQDGLVTLLEFPSMQSVFRRKVSSGEIRGKAGEPISSLAFSNFADGEQSRYLAAACWDQNIYLLRLQWRTKPGPKHTLETHREIVYRGALTGNSSSPTHVMFTSDAQYLVSNSTDLAILVWKTGTGERLSCLSALRDMSFDCWRNVLGWPVAGVWKQCYAQSDVNAVCQSSPQGGGCGAGTVIAVGDDLGSLNLFRFPAPLSHARGREYGGHASHVTNVRFSPSNVLVSLGGGDHTLMQWRLEATEVSLLTRAKEAHRRSLPPRQLPWAAPAAPPEPEAAATAKEVLQNLGNPPPLPPKPPAAGYPGFQGPFEGDVFSRRSGSARSSRSDLRAGSMDRITQPGSASRALSGSGGVSAGGRASSLRSRQQTPAAAACRRLASKGRL